MTIQEIKQLLTKYKHNRISEDEYQRLLDAVADGQHPEIIKADILAALQTPVPEAGWKEEDAAVMLADILQTAATDIPSISRHPRPERRRKRAYMAAAVLAAGLLAAGAYITLQRTPPHPAPVAQQHPLAPGSSKAMLTLADGSTIPLDSTSNGALAQQGNTQILNRNGTLSYQAAGNSIHVLYNKVVTPRGGQYQLTLADGSRVWLNAASSIRFPTAFTGKERLVEITGEVYFEIARNADMPFRVSVQSPQTGNTLDVNVLGTSFNIMAYGDEQTISTTLVEGAVQLAHGGNTSLLKPGTQASLSAQNNNFVITTANMEETLAWKEGKFRFRNTSIQTIMRQLARWYNIEVAYQGNLSDVDLTGVISRRENADQLLKALEATQRVHFEVTGNRVTVMPAMQH